VNDKLIIGAGKTTLISMMTGSLVPSSGIGKIFGFDIANGVSQYLYFTGFCSQEDILISNMTPFEHVQVFAGIRGIDMTPFGDTENYCLMLLKKVQLEYVIHKRVDQFSGGMQRRLSFILSTIGENKVYYLDEPTTGLDPISRRYMWDVIQDLKKNSIVLLTSHNMQEAEYLADKSNLSLIAVLVMVKGKLVAAGPPLNLKNTFANEYQLRMTPKQKIVRFEGMEYVADWAISNLPGSFKILSTDKVITIGVPRNTVDRLGDFLTALESTGDLEWSIGDSSLEELFLTISADGFNAEDYKVKSILRRQNQLNQIANP
jgi:ABC-type multidrug transport system ATPase subunit